MTQKTPPPLPNSADLYADAVSRGDKETLATYNRESLSFEILAIAKATMELAAAGGSTNLTQLSTYSNSTHLRIDAAAPSAGVSKYGSRYACQVNLPFFPSNKFFSRMAQRASLRILGRDEFCQRFAKRLCVEVARKEAEHLHELHEPLPAGVAARAERAEIAREAHAPDSKAPRKPSRI